METKADQFLKNVTKHSMAYNEGLIEGMEKILPINTQQRKLWKNYLDINDPKSQ